MKKIFILTTDSVKHKLCGKEEKRSATEPPAKAIITEHIPINRDKDSGCFKGIVESDSSGEEVKEKK